ncbi:hypothetical protein WJX74_000195 [Apatococcus lobatus]|uniref:Uncharacterized protein n=1 Tax=Apatococcus lobatus TaxID=904363 RepID=A0AAW1RM67_9CHLO
MAETQVAAAEAGFWTRSSLARGACILLVLLHFASWWLLVWKKLASERVEECYQRPVTPEAYTLMCTVEVLCFLWASLLLVSEHGMRPAQEVKRQGAFYLFLDRLNGSKWVLGLFLLGYGAKRVKSKHLPAEPQASLVSVALEFSVSSLALLLVVPDAFWTVRVCLICVVALLRLFSILYGEEQANKGVAEQFWAQQDPKLVGLYEQSFKSSGLGDDLAHQEAVRLAREDLVRARARHELGLNMDKLSNPCSAEKADFWREPAQPESGAPHPLVLKYVCHCSSTKLGFISQTSGHLSALTTATTSLVQIRQDQRIGFRNVLVDDLSDTPPAYQSNLRQASDAVRHCWRRQAPGAKVLLQTGERLLVESRGPGLCLASVQPVLPVTDLQGSNSCHVLQTSLTERRRLLALPGLRALHFDRAQLT